MQCFKVGTAALNQTPLDWQGNRSNIISAITQAKSEGVNLLCLPELCISGYGCEDAFLGMGTCEQALASLKSILPQTQGIAVCLGLPLHWRGAIFNVAAYIFDGKVRAMVGKRHLAGDGLHYEPRWFRPWPEDEQVHFQDGEIDCPLGDCLIDHAGVRIGFEICEDAWVAQRPASKMAAMGMDILFNPSASHFAFDKHRVRERLVQEGSRALGATYIYANLLGNEAGRIIYDGDCLIASAGQLIQRGPRLEFTDTVLTTAVVDVDRTRRHRAQIASASTAVEDPAIKVTVSDPLPGCDEMPTEATGAEIGAEPVKNSNFARAVALGLADHLRKSRSRGFVVSLSGGADSAAVASLCYLAWVLGNKTHGEEAWCQRLNLPQGTTFDRFLTCVYQATKNSGDVTHNAAKGLADALGASFHSISVDALVNGYTEVVEQMLDRPLTWETDDIPLQNIQARARAPSVWMLANCLGALLLSTSNRSEAAVGYATMDGDTSGGLSPISGIDKAFLREWLVWMETVGLPETGPIPALNAVTAQAPTAELRPQAAAQTDESDLMPYPVLDHIERLAIRDRHPPGECRDMLIGKFPQFDRKTLTMWTVRFFRLWSRNQWKRERYAPGFHLDDENLDPKTWCRFPILSGGFAQELAELEAGEP